MKLNEEIEELLAEIYIKLKEEQQVDDFVSSLLQNQDKNILSLLIENKLIEPLDAGFNVNKNGLDVGRHMVRKKRLAEKLLVDILNVKHDVDHIACDFEHHINDEVEEKVCVLLGHPEMCPHGELIPVGECCLKARKDLEKLNILLIKLAPGEMADVIYLNTANNIEMQKLISIGLLPGARIKILRVFPSIVFEHGNSQFAIDENIGKIVHVRKIQS